VAVATNAALSVVAAHSCGLGGDAFWLIWDGKRVEALNGSGRSAALATLDGAAAAGLDQMPERGPWTVTVPGAVRSWGDAHSRHGRLSWRPLFDGALELAAGFPATPGWIEHVERSVPIFGTDGDWARTFRPHGRAWRSGETVKLPALMSTLRVIAHEGPDSFYEQSLGRRAAEYLASRGSPVRAADLAAHRSTWADAISVRYRDVTSVSHPPNSSGPIALEMLALLDRFAAPERAAFGADGVRDADWIHLGLEAARIGLIDRDRFLTDPDEAPDMPGRLLDTARIDDLARQINRDRASPQVGLAPPNGGGTVFVAAADAQGTLVSMLESNFRGFGSGLVDPQTGVAYQNRGSFFSLDPRQANVLAPAKRTAHTLTPGMLMRGQRPWMAHGAMGSEIQPQIFAQFVSSVIDGGLDIATAISAPRWALSLPYRPGDTAKVDFEAGYVAGMPQRLAELGWPVSPTPPDSWFMGHAHAVEMDEEEGRRVLRAAHDPRSEGAALAW
jgi:gamma-glutamyltranspeptidase/glutathione hydrolase